jgi:Ribosomal protein S19
MGLIKKLRKAKKEAPPNEKPTVVKTHLRDMIIVPEMIGSVVGIYNGKVRSDSFGRWKGRSLNLMISVYRCSIPLKSSLK